MLKRKVTPSWLPAVQNAVARGLTDVGDGQIFPARQIGDSAGRSCLSRVAER